MLATVSRVTTPPAAVITGAAGGLGSASVRRLAARGWQVFAADLDTPALHALRDERVTPVPVDVTDAASVGELAERVHERSPALAGVVNFAGVLEIGPVVEIDEAAFRRVLDVNVVGTFLVTKALFPAVLRGRGRVVLISSETGWQTAMPLNGPYATSKHAIEAYGDALRRELMLLGVAVVKIQPGAFRTGMVDSMMARFERMAAHSEHYASALRLAMKRLPQEERRAGDPDDLAALVERVLTARQVRPAYRIHTNPRARALDRLPARVTDRLLMAAFRRA